MKKSLRKEIQNLLKEWVKTNDNDLIYDDDVDKMIEVVYGDSVLHDTPLLLKNIIILFHYGLY